MSDARLNIRVIPGARREGIAGRYADGLKVRVAAPPEGGKANHAVLALIAEALGLPIRQVVVLRGHTQPRKVLQVGGMSQEQLDAWVRSFT